MKKTNIFFSLLFLLGLTANIASSYSKEGLAPQTTYVSHTELFVMRSGETKFDVRQAVSASYARDITLTEKGYIEAVTSAALIHSAAPIDYIITSPIMRAHQTALIAADEMGIDKGAIILDDRLREQSFGYYEGRSHTDYIAQFDTPDDQFIRGSADGETGEQVRERVTNFLNEIATSPKYRGKNILIITEAYPAAHMKRHFTENWQRLPETGEWSRFSLLNHN